MVLLAPTRGAGCVEVTGSRSPAGADEEPPRSFCCRGRALAGRPDRCLRPARSYPARLRPPREPAPLELLSQGLAMQSLISALRSRRRARDYLIENRSKPSPTAGCCPAGDCIYGFLVRPRSPPRGTCRSAVRREPLSFRTWSAALFRLWAGPPTSTAPDSPFWVVFPLLAISSLLLFDMAVAVAGS